MRRAPSGAPQRKRLPAGQANTGDADARTGPSKANKLDTRSQGASGVPGRVRRQRTDGGRTARSAWSVMWSMSCSPRVAPPTALSAPCHRHHRASSSRARRATQITQICAHQGRRHQAQSAAPNGGYLRIGPGPAVVAEGDLTPRSAYRRIADLAWLIVRRGAVNLGVRDLVIWDALDGTCAGAPWPAERYGASAGRRRCGHPARGPARRTLR